MWVLSFEQVHLHLNVIVVLISNELQYLTSLIRFNVLIRLVIISAVLSVAGNHLIINNFTVSQLYLAFRMYLKVGFGGQSYLRYYVTVFRNSPVLTY